MTPHDIHALRLRLGWPQAQMAQFMGVSSMAISQWERGETAPGPYKRAALEQLKRRLDEAEAARRREQFMDALTAATVAASVGAVLGFLFGDRSGDGGPSGGGPGGDDNDNSNDDS